MTTPNHTTRRGLLAAAPTLLAASLLVTSRRAFARNPNPVDTGTVGKRTVISGVTVTNLGTPLCVAANGAPKVARGGLYNKLTADVPSMGFTDPWNSFPPLSGYYSALRGDIEPAVAIYDLTTARDTLVFIWGTPDEGNRLQFLHVPSAALAAFLRTGDETLPGVTIIATLFGNAIAGTFGWNDGINLQFDTSAPFNMVKLVSYNISFEWANFLQNCQ